MGVEIRAGLHVGEVEVLEGKVGGFAVNVGARVMGAGKAGEVLVSSTLRDAVAGSGFEFADHVVHQLKGIDGEWRLFEVMRVDGIRRAPPLVLEEARERREFIRATPSRRRSGWAIAAASLVVGLLLVAVVLVTNPFGEAASSQNQPDEDT